MQTHFYITIAIALFLAILIFSGPTHYKTDRKELLTEKLVDSSVVKLNSESKLTLINGFNKNHRKVAIKGEVFFAVQEGNFPFVVTTECAEIRVMGTQFIVKSRNHRIEVAVKEGKVEVSSMFAQKGNIVTLTKRQSISISKGEFPNKPQKIGFEQYFAWIYGKIGFHETSLRYAVEEVERRFDITIQLAGRVDERKAITGLFEANDVDNVLTAICQSIHLNYYEVENGVYKIY